MTPTMFCRQCGYILNGLSGEVCTECGRPFLVDGQYVYATEWFTPAKRVFNQCMNALLMVIMVANVLVILLMWLVAVLLWREGALGAGIVIAVFSFLPVLGMKACKAFTRPRPAEAIRDA